MKSGGRQHLNDTRLIVLRIPRNREEAESFAVGHFAFGYILGKLTAKIVKSEVNIPLILTLSIIPDIDMLTHFLWHRGPTHSIVMATIIFIPVFLKWRRTALPYFIALIQHPLVGDFLAGGKTQLFWPVTSQLYGTVMDIRSIENITLEWTLFLLFVAIIAGNGGLQKFFQPHNSNLILLIPLGAITLQTFLNYPLYLPLPMIPPHLFFITLFSTSILIDLNKKRRKTG